EPRPLGRALDQAGDVHELDDGGDLLLGLHELVQSLEPGIRDLDYTDVRLDGAEGIVLRGGRFGGSQGVEERRFPDVGEAYYTEAEHVSAAISRPRPSSEASPLPPSLVGRGRTARARTRTSRSRPRGAVPRRCGGADTAATGGRP